MSLDSLLLPYQLHHLLHLYHPLHHLDLDRWYSSTRAVNSSARCSACLCTSISRASQAAWMSALDEREDEEVVIPCPTLLT